MEELIRKRIGEIPILQTVIQRLELREIMSSYIKTHGNETVPAVDTLLLLVCNIACGRQPLYELPEWVEKLDHGLLGACSGCLLRGTLWRRPLRQSAEQGLCG